MPWQKKIKDRSSSTSGAEALGQKARGIQKKIYFGLGFLVLSFCALLLKDVFVYRQTPEREFRDISVKIQGEVTQPGSYRMNAGSTVYELLMVAGVKTSGSVEQQDLYRPLKDGELIQVAQNIAGKSVKVSTAPVRKCQIVALKGGEPTIRRNNISLSGVGVGTELLQYDEIITGKGQQIELEFDDLSLFKLEENSKLVLTYLSVNQNNLETKTWVEIKNGLLFADVNYTGEKTNFLFNTPHAEVTVKGTVLSIGVSGTTQVNVYRGRVYVKPIKASSGLDIRSNQMTMVDAKSTTITAAELKEEPPSESRFAGLKRSKKQAKSVSFIYICIPSPYVFIQINKSTSRINIIRIPNETIVSDFVEGFDHLDKALLYGGAQFLVSLIEQILQVPIQFYLIHRREDVIKSIDLIEGLTIDVDPEISPILDLKPGVQVLDGLMTARFGSPSVIGGTTASWKRQQKVIQAFLDKMISGSAVMTGSLVTNILKDVETNFNTETCTELVNVLRKGNWGRDTQTVPGFSVLKGGRTSWKASVKDIEAILNK